jgi:hypothetical protein
MKLERSIFVTLTRKQRRSKRKYKRHKTIINGGLNAPNKINIMRKFNRYRENLRQDQDRILSYDTHVATIEGDTLRQLGYWSMTTQKHINYAAKELNLTLIKN